MNHVLLIYISIVVMGGVLSTFLSIYAFFKLKNAPGGMYFIVATSLSAAFTFSYACELASTSLEQLKFWLMMEYFALPFIPVFILLMCLDYTGQKPSRGVYYFLIAIPVITIFMHNTNELHHLYYSNVGLRDDTPFLILELEKGPWFYVHSIFLYLCIAISISVLLFQLKNSSFRFQMQILLMATGLLAPVIASVIYINGMSHYGIDLGPVFMSVSFIFHAVALLSFQMFDVAPIARDVVFESMEEGVVVLNQNNQIVDYNPAALKVMPLLTAHMIGQPVSALIHGNRQLNEIIDNEKECDYQLLIDDKPFHLQTRFSAVKNKRNARVGKIVTFSDVTERAEMEEKLKQLARMDGLTNIYNRTFFLELAEEIFSDFHLTGGEVSIIMFDVDYFKKVNDTIGHEAGDVVLAHVAQVAKETIGAEGIIGRYGGEEFVACCPNMTLQEAVGLADAIRKNIAENVAVIEGRKIGVTLSLGVSNVVIAAEAGETSLQTSMRQADRALYTAKKNGRNRVELYEEDMVSAI